jgi:ABC-2 type transport system permease protein
MTILAAIAEVTARGLLSRRRTLLMVLLAAVPVLVAVLVRLGGRAVDSADAAAGVMDVLVVRAVLPLLALVFGTAALGAELDDGTGIYVLVKPVARWRIVLAKLLVAGGLTSALVVPSVVLTGLLIVGADGTGLEVIGRFVVATAIGAFAYAAVFLALGAMTTRALIVGLIYTFLWEGALAGLFDGVQVLSVRQYVLGIAGVGSLDAMTGLVLAVVVGGLASWLATALLVRFQVRAAD